MPIRRRALLLNEPFRLAAACSRDAPSHRYIPAARTVNLPGLSGSIFEILVLVGHVWAALGTAEFAYIVGLSLPVSLSATAVAAVVGLPCWGGFGNLPVPRSPISDPARECVPRFAAGCRRSHALPDVVSLGAFGRACASVYAQRHGHRTGASRCTDHHRLDASCVRSRSLGKNTAAHCVSMAQPDRGRSGCFWRSRATLS